MSLDTTTGDAPRFNEHLDYNDPKGTENKLACMLDEIADAGDVDQLIELLTQIARFQGLQHKFDEAQQTLDKASSLLKNKDSVAKARYLLEQGRKHRSSGLVEEAVPFFEKAYQCAQAISEDYYAVDAIHMLAICASGKDAIVWGEKAIALAEQSKDQYARHWLGALYNNIGWDCHEQGQYERALELFRRGFEFRMASGPGITTRIAKWAVCRALRSLGRHEEAIVWLKELEIEWEQAGKKSGFVFEELAENLQSLDDEDIAKDYFTKAYNELKNNPDIESDQLERIGKMAGCL
ncbi:tetratricopeptide repeat protein [Poriferisphaera sp. WC338]|uniref:tetratricopeptide repeat protein n=1 Tax=Poriferisphaera sp. WC338 TaxID=3425129 RepID=UPI003D816880